MQIDWLNFTPWSALAGGALIGLAAALLVVFNGRIAGISGILGELPKRGEGSWRWMFVAGLALSPLLYSAFTALPLTHLQQDPTTLVIAGLLVGLGTRYGNGCTSGHGVCGLARLSWRSLVATLVFMAAGILTVLLVRHGLA